MEGRDTDFASSIGLLVLRVGVGGYLATHGWGKLQMLLHGQFEGFDVIGIGAKPSLVLVTFAEFVCSLLVAAGFFTRLAAIPPVLAMGVAAFVVHRADPWTMEKAFAAFQSGATKMPLSKEPALMFLAPFLALAFLGAGRFSIDGWFRSRRAPG